MIIDFAAPFLDSPLEPLGNLAHKSMKLSVIVCINFHQNGSDSPISTQPLLLLTLRLVGYQMDYPFLEIAITVIRPILH